MHTVITILLSVFGWLEMYKAADERNWIRFFLGLILLAMGAIRFASIYG